MRAEHDQDTTRRTRAREVGLFRYGLIQDALDPALSTKQRGRLVRSLASQVHPGPFGVPVRVSRASLDRWIRTYRAGGFTALVPAPRRLTRTGAPNGPGWTWEASDRTSRPRCLVDNAGSSASWMSP